MSSKRQTLWLDYETYCPLDLRKVGLDAYSAHPECEVLLAAWAVDGGPVRQWDATKDPEPPADLVELLRDDDVLVEAWNAPFERYITERVLRIEVPVKRWRDTMIRSYHAGLPGKLETAGMALGIPKQKLETGVRLVRKFCAPRRPTKKNPATRNLPADHPEDWEEFCEYNRRDVEAQRLVAGCLPPVPDFIWEEWFLDQKINDRGIPINLCMARNAADLYDVEHVRLMDIVRERTGLLRPNHAPSMLAWARARGYPGRDMRAATIRAVLEQVDDLDPFLRETLEIYQKASLTSPKKYRAIERSIGPGDRLRGAFQFYGAMRTGRWAGRTFQPQNLPRPPKWLMAHYDETADLLEVVDDPAVLELVTGGEPVEVLKGMIRAVAQAPEGHVLVDADYSAIENRVVGWLAGEDKILRVFAEGKDPYIDFATRLFDMPYEAIKAECDAGDKSKRTLAKPGVLGCLAAGTLVLTSRGWVPIEQVRPDDLVHDGNGWRRHSGVVFQGVKRVIEVVGVWMTPDHRILCGEGQWVCAEDADTSHISRATRLAFGKLSSSLGSFHRPVSSIGFDAPPGMFACTDDTGWTGGSVAWIARVLFGGSFSGVLTGRGKFCRTGSMPSGQDAARQGVIRAMVGGVSNAVSRMLTSLSGMLSRFLGFVKATIVRSTGLTTTAIMSQATCGWLHVLRIIPTSVTTDMCGSMVGSGRPGSSGSGSRHDTGTKGLWPARYGRGCLRSRLSKSSGGVEAPTFDILDVEETSRFVILTDAGPMIVHNCAYRLGPGHVEKDLETGLETATGLLGYAWAMGVKITERQAAEMVGVFRSTYRKVTTLWYDLDDALEMCVRDGRRVRVGKLLFELGRRWMRIRLPSGRHLYYYRPRWEEVTTPWGDRKMQVTYMAQQGGKWMRVSTHGGKIVENCWAAGTPVVTKRGIVSIESIRPDDLIWDGVEFVSHAGLRVSVRSPVIRWGGVWVTPDHTVLVGDTWLPVSIVRPCDAVSALEPTGLPVEPFDVEAGIDFREGDVVLARTYDILNCGPRHRYAVWLPDEGRAVLAHNCVQAIARDLLAYGLRRADEAGLDVRLHIHDQIVCVAPEEKAKEALETLIGIMSQKPDWARGLPLSGDGFICKKLRKD